MKQDWLQFFKEENGQFSSNRLIYIGGCAYAMVMGVMVFVVTKDWLATTMTVSSLVTTFSAVKLIQKSQETKPVN